MSLVRHVRHTAKALIQNLPIAGRLASRTDFSIHARQFPRNYSGVEEETRTILETLEREGLAILPNYFDRATCDTCLHEIERMLHDRPDIVQRSGSDQRIYGAEHLSALVKVFATDLTLLRVACLYQ